MATFLAPTARVLTTLVVRRSQTRLLGGALRMLLVSGLLLLVGSGLLVATAISAVVTQHSTLPWPVPVPAADAPTAGWRAGGWQITSGYGWRDDPTAPGTRAFHDGVDLAGAPFALGAAVPAVLDGRVDRLGWDQPDASDPSTAGGGLMVEITSGEPRPGLPINDKQFTTAYGHLQPYRLFVRIEGRITDPDGQGGSYDLVGSGDRTPLPTLAIGCSGDQPTFVPRVTGPGQYEFWYDRPATCTATVTWAARGDGWTGWAPDSPTTLTWQTRVGGNTADDTALRFQGTLIPPPPPETPMISDTVTPVPLLTPVGGSTLGMAVQAGCQPTPAQPCRWTLAALPQGGRGAWLDLPNEPALLISDPAAAEGDSGAEADSRATIAPTVSHPSEEVVLSAPALPNPTPVATADDATVERAIPRGSPGARPTPTAVLAAQTTVAPVYPTSVPLVAQRKAGVSAPLLPAADCTYVGLRRLSASAPNAQMHPAAAASFEQLRQRIRLVTGEDALAVLGDVLRAPAYATDKPGVAFRSWHKAGRAVDLNIGGPWRVVPEGSRFRIFHRTSGVDITALFEAAGWRRIPAQGSTAEWWHYEYHAGVSWEGAMRQVWPLPVLQRDLPGIPWSSVPCTSGDDPGPLPVPVPGGVTDDAGIQVCTPGQPTWTVAVESVPGCGPPVRLGQEVRQLDDWLGFVGLTGKTTGPHLHFAVSFQDVQGLTRYTNICQPPFLAGSVPPDTPDCWTPWADPLDFLPLAQGGDPLPGATAAPLDGEPYQLPPPGVAGALVRTLPDDTPRGEYWSPYQQTGRFGGGSIWAWLERLLCWVFPWFGFCGA